MVRSSYARSCERKTQADRLFFSLHHRRYADGSDRGIDRRMPLIKLDYTILRRFDEYQLEPKSMKFVTDEAG